MIEAGRDRDKGFAARLCAAAERLALAHAETRIRARGKDPRRWRNASLLWPLFTKD